MSKKFIEGDVNISNLYLDVLPEFLSDVEIRGDFFCDQNDLLSLKGSPQAVKGEFSCTFNELENLKGSPQIVNGDFDCNYNNLLTLDGCPEVVGWDFYCMSNKVKFTEEQVRAVCKVGGRVYV